MATVNAVVYEHHKKADGTYNVKIKIFHQKIERTLTPLITYLQDN
jgi:hypothetical protein